MNQLRLSLLLLSSLAHAGELPDELRRRIASDIAVSYPGFSRAVNDAKTRASSVASPWKRAQIWRFEKFLPTRPLIFFVAVAGRDVLVLTGAPPARFNMMIEGKPAGGAEALAWVRLYDETTAKADERRLILRSVDEIPFRPKLPPEKAQLRDQAKQALETVIQPPSAKRLQNGDWEVVELAIEGELLVERRCVVTAKIDCRVSRLRDDLPLVYAQ